MAIDIFFGIPGSGKTTLSAFFCNKSLKQNRRVFSNFPLRGSLEFSVSDLGVFDMSDSLVIIDEAGLDFNNRNFKTFTNEQNYFFKFHRHFNCDILIFSQSYDDMDKKIRLLARSIFVVRKSIIPFFITYRRIGRNIGIDKNNHTIADIFDFVPFSKRWIFTPPLWKCFDTYFHSDLMVRSFNYWEVNVKKN